MRKGLCWKGMCDVIYTHAFLYTVTGINIIFRYNFSFGKQSYNGKWRTEWIEMETQKQTLPSKRSFTLFDILSVCWELNIVID